MKELFELAKKIKYLGYSRFTNYHYERENYPTEEGWLGMRKRINRMKIEKLEFLFEHAKNNGDLEIAFNLGREIYSRISKNFKK